MRVPAKYLNLGLLILGFGLGQGSLFLANTYLFWSHHYELVAAFGAANALLTFLYFIADWGGIVYLAKEAVMRRPGQRPLAVSYLALSLVRLTVAVVFYAGLVALQFGTQTSFATEYNVFAGLGLLAYAFNASGVLDGGSKAGISGLTQALPVIAAAVALPACVGLDMATAGQILGGAYALGMTLTIALQLRAARINWAEARAGLSWRTLLAVGRDAVPYMLTPLPGQALFRAQVLLAVTYLTPQLVALFIYARQIIGIGYQALGFYLRVDLKDFAEHLTKATPSAGRVLATSVTVRMGGAGTIGLVIASASLWSFKPDIAHALLIYAPCVVTIAAASTLQRAFLLQSRATETVVILCATVAVPVAVIWPVFSSTSIMSLVLIEFIGLCMQVGLFVYRWRGAPA